MPPSGCDTFRSMPVAPMRDQARIAAGRSGTSS